MVATDHVVARCQPAVGGGGDQVLGVGGGGGQVEGHGHAGQHVEQGRVGGGDAAGVEEGGDGTGGDGGRGGVGGVAGVVLGAAADGDVLEDQAGGDVGEGLGGWGFCVSLVASGGVVWSGCDLLATGSFAALISQAGAWDICLPSWVFCASMLKYWEMSLMASPGMAALRLRSG